LISKIDQQGLKNLKDKLILTVICGCCGKILQRGDPENVSDGICPTCYKDLMMEVVSHGLATKEGAHESLKPIQAAEKERETQLALF
jgi:hypothetical protein